DFANNIYVRQKIHFNTALAFALASFAAAPGHIERKAPGLVAALARLRQHGIKVANVRENLGVSGRIRPRCAANRRLIDANDLVNGPRTGDGLVLARLLARSVQGLRERPVENVVYER